MAHATNTVYNELSEPTTQMPVKTLKRLAADAGLLVSAFASCVARPVVAGYPPPPPVRGARFLCSL